MRRHAGIVVAAWLLCCPAISHAQVIEVTPFIGYRFGGDFFELITGQSVDLDGARAVGGVVNVKFNNEGLFAEALFTHQEAQVTFPGRGFAPPTNWRITVDHWQGGGLQEFGSNQHVRPFLTGLLGLTRYAAEGDNETSVHHRRRWRSEADARTTHRRSARWTGVRDVRGYRRSSDCLLARLSASRRSTPTSCGRLSSAPGSSWRFRT